MMSQMRLASSGIFANAPTTKTSTRPPLNLLSAVAIGPSEPGGVSMLMRTGSRGRHSAFNYLSITGLSNKPGLSCNQKRYFTPSGLYPFEEF